jgi:hypothetical protein
MAAPENPRQHLYLLIALLLLIIAAPIVVPLRHGILVINVIGATVLILASYAVSDRKDFLAVAIIFSAATVIANSFLLVYPSHVSVVIAHSSMIFILGFFAVSILGYVVHSGRVTADRIYAAICAYLLIGYAWAFGYALFDEFQPGAFAAVTEVARNDYIGRVNQMRYFSFITLATVGYGDIVPRTAGARTMAILEAIVGQFYLVALIGRLVGLHIVHGSSSQRAEVQRD